MKKTTVRFAAVGAVLLLGALALALAQHDARQRPREAAAPAKSTDGDPKPIPMDEEPAWRTHPLTSHSKTLVRANNDQSQDSAPPSLEFQPDAAIDGSSMPLTATLDAAIKAASHNDAANNEANGGLQPLRAVDNPLRSANGSTELAGHSASLADDSSTDGDATALGGVQPLGSFEDDSHVQAAGGQSGMPLAPQPLVATPLPSTSTPAPSRTSAMPLPEARLQAPPPGAAMATPPAAGALSTLALPSSPAIPSTSTSQPLPNAPPASLPGSNAPQSPNSIGPPPPGWVNAGPAPSSRANQSLSDTQRAAMQPTNMTGQQPWMQAPPMTSSNNIPSTSRSEGNVVRPPQNSGSGPIPPAGRAPGQLISQELQPPVATLGSPAVIAPPGAQPPSAAMPGSISGSMPGLPAGNPSMPNLPNNMPANNMPANNLPASNLPSAGSGVPSAGMPNARQNDPRSGGPNSFDGTARGAMAGTAIGSLVSNQPDNRHLDGSKHPIMQIQKRMPEECTVGKRTTVVITVRNAGNAAAQDVKVFDSVPNGASFAESMPAVTPTPDGILVWKLGEMGPGDERTITLQIIPERQGELGSTAEVRIATLASMRTLATSPKLELSLAAQPEVLIGSQHSIDVTVKNIGSGMARDVRLEADLPNNLRHETGDASLEAPLGDIAPGEAKHIRLYAVATDAGGSSCAIRALTEDGLQQEQKLELKVLAPALQAAISGPNRRFLDRQATFDIMIKNTGTAPATRCEFVLRLPAGLNFNTANKSGGYDPSQHAVRWYVDEFPAGHAEPVQVTVLPVEVGVQQMTFQGTADLGVTTEARGGLTVEEQGELTFTIDQDADPIEVSASTTYTVEVRNVGRPDRNVELIMQLPPGSQVLKVDAPVASRVEGDQLRFDPIPQMDGRSSQKFRMEVRHSQVGTQIVRAQLKSQNRPAIVSKEEATEVYNDQ